MTHKGAFSEIARLIREKNKILLASHESPDGDALGSMTAMFSAIITHSGKEILMFSKDPVPSNLKFIPRVESISSAILNFSPDLFIALDYGDFARLGVSEREVGSATTVTFDHHPEYKQKGDIKVIDTSYSSTCEIVYDFFVSQNYTITPDIAKSLLAGIFTDTGGLAHVNTTIKTLRAVGDLLKRGASLRKVQKHAFAEKSEGALKVWGRVLSDISRDEGAGMAYAIVSSDKFRELGASLENFEGLVNLIAAPPDVAFSLLLIEREPGLVKGSMRSEPFKGMDVSRIARSLGGGGHKYAAGFEMRGETLKNVVEYVKKAAAEVVQGRENKAA